jgi:hypothetical protein
VRVRSLCLIVLLALAWPVAGRAEPEVLPRLAAIQPWSWASRLIGYDGRLWFLASQRPGNNDTADVYSLDRAEGVPRYEHHLFSQDAAEPVVHRGLLYWPSEDSRFSLGWADPADTNGVAWWWGSVRGPRSLHVLALASLGGRLYASTSAWRTDLQVSDDGGLTWSTTYSRSGPGGDMSRLRELAVVGDDLYMVARDGKPRSRDVLLKLSGGQVTEVLGWPAGPRIPSIEAWRGRLYGVVKDPQGRTLWVTDGATSRRIVAWPKGQQLSDLAAGDDALWAVSYHSGGGFVWRSTDGFGWHAVARVRDGEPVAIALVGDRPYVGGPGADGTAGVWGPHAVATVTGKSQGPSRAELPRRRKAADRDWNAIGATVDAALAEPKTYEPKEDALRELIYDAAISGVPAGVFASRLDAQVPDVRISLANGKSSASAAEFARWTLLWGIAIQGRGHIDPRWLALPWTAPKNSSAKYFGTAPAALWAISRTGQRDRDTIDTLIQRLAEGRDPMWLKGDIVGAVSAVTGERFGYDAAAWRAWWSAARDTWPVATSSQ